MESDVSLGTASRFELKGAILVYSGGHLANGAFAAWHEAGQLDAGTPILGPATPLSTGFLRDLSRGLGAMVHPEILPENVLARTPDMLIWWTKARRCTMFFSAAEALGPVSGRVFPQPPLLFKVTRKELSIRALSSSGRPTSSTALSVAPYYNVNAESLVCQGSMRSPGHPAVAAMPEWEKAFFDSEFTHIYGGGHFTKHAGGLVGLWTGLAGAERFPLNTLVPAKETLAQFAERDR